MRCQIVDPDGGVWHQPVTPLRRLTPLSTGRWRQRPPVPRFRGLPCVPAVGGACAGASFRGGFGAAAAGAAAAGAAGGGGADGVTIFGLLPAGGLPSDRTSSTVVRTLPPVSPGF